MKIKETRTMTMDDLRSLCIIEDWYTCGDCDEYSNLLNMTKDGNRLRNITADILYEMAVDIKQHSDLSEEYPTTAIMYNLAAICHSTFEIVE